MADTKDNCADSVQFFEGVEKLLEIWFTSSKDGQRGDLRQIPRESSMFVSQRRFILKTCGTTTPLQCLEPLLKLVEEYTGWDDVENVFYSRKNYKRPELQISPHQTFEEEVALLHSLFPDGEAYCLGSPETDCWYLYTLSRDKTLQDPPEPDQTLEILMTHLDPEIMSIFTKDVCSSADEATVKSGIDKLIPDMIIDDFLFEPCGYSMNGVSKNGKYMTIHITPEPEFSYVSFESNVSETSYDEIILRVLNTFKPGKFLVTIFANKESAAANCPRDFENSDYLNRSGDWLRTNVQYYHFKSYDLTCAFYSRLHS
ncbi:S-adenosylmethionine decarboxylase proenzyme isoform X2 [Harpegnathos saltator]|uniref:S-adenosylmethionine decarboxylase proenzyme isoform X2 n=1 Tax=Harpegnathos saltator TaxID=610380 RepID=UPI00058E3966|nr:S-adenosylmethionine decarboxylase proenzyme isoform X2 [Harpegnathos saltator]